MTSAYFRDVPLPDVVVHEGDTDPLYVTLTQADGVTPVDLSGRIVEFRLRAYRGDQTALTFRSDGTGTPPIAIISPATTGVVRITPTATSFVATAEFYRGYFSLFATATPSTLPQIVPQGRDFWIQVLAKVV